MTPAPKSPAEVAEEELQKECNCGQAETLANKRAAVEAFADVECEPHTMHYPGEWLEIAKHNHAACRAALIKEIFG